MGGDLLCFDIRQFDAGFWKVRGLVWATQNFLLGPSWKYFCVSLNINSR